MRYNLLAFTLERQFFTEEIFKMLCFDNDMKMMLVECIVGGNFNLNHKNYKSRNRKLFSDRIKQTGHKISSINHLFDRFYRSFEKLSNGSKQIDLMILIKQLQNVQKSVGT